MKVVTPIYKSMFRVTGNLRKPRIALRKPRIALRKPRIALRKPETSRDVRRRSDDF